MKIYEDSLIPFITDTHFGSKSFNKSVFESMMLFFEDQFFPWCLKNNIKNVIHCGDLVHNRNMIDIWINQQIKSRFFKFFQDNDINLHILVGNHDLYYKSSMEVNYLIENTREFSNIKIYSEQEKIQIGKYSFLMVPWVINDSNFEFKESADICCGHFETIGFKMTSQMYADDGFNAQRFNDKFKITMSGHFHIKSSKKNIHYIGTQYPITWNDYNETKGFYVLGKEFKLKYIENKVNAKFVKLYYSELDGQQEISASGLKKSSVKISPQEAIDIAKNNYCKLITKSVEHQGLLDTFYQSLVTVSRDAYKIETVDSNEIIESFDVSEIEEQIQEETDIETTVSSYLSGMTFEADIDKKYLIDMFQELYKESSDKVVEE